MYLLFCAPAVKLLLRPLIFLSKRFSGDFFQQIRKFCPCLTKFTLPLSYVNGAKFWYSRKPIIYRVLHYIFAGYDLIKLDYSGVHRTLLKLFPPHDPFELKSEGATVTPLQFPHILGTIYTDRHQQYQLF